MVVNWLKVKKKDTTSHLKTNKPTNFVYYLHLRENVGTPPGHCCKKTWPEVPGGVNSIAGVEAHGQSNDQNHKAHSEGLQSLGDGIVVGIHDSQNANNERCGANDLRSKASQSQTVNVALYISERFVNDGNYLVKEAVYNREMFSRVSSKDSSRGISSRHIESSREVEQGILKDDKS